MGKRKARMPYGLAAFFRIANTPNAALAHKIQADRVKDFRFRLLLAAAPARKQAQANHTARRIELTNACAGETAGLSDQIPA